MTFPEELLAEGEAVVADVRPSGWSVVGQLLMASAAAAALWGAAHLLPSHGSLEIVRYLILFQTVKVLIVGGLIPLLRWLRTRYTLTNLRLILRHGVFRRTTRQIPLDQLVVVPTKRSGTQRLLGGGTLTVESRVDKERATLKSMWLAKLLEDARHSYVK